MKAQSSIISPPPVEIISGANLIAEPIEETPAIVIPQIPVGGITLLFGPPGVGKTALCWALGNAMAEGEDFLGHRTIRGKILFISLDMNKTLCKIRLHITGFTPRFEFVFSNLPVDCLHQGFKNTDLYKAVRRELSESHYDLIVIDALGKLGRFEMSDEKAPNQVYGALYEWLPDKTILLNHHSRKLKFTVLGKEIERTMEDAFGSQFWTAFAASVIHLQRTGFQSGKLIHCKSQVLELAEPISVCVDPETSTLGLFEDRKAETAENRIGLWEEKARVKHQDWDSLGQENQVNILMEISGKSRRTIYRYLQASKGGRRSSVKRGLET